MKKPLRIKYIIVANVVSAMNFLMCSLMAVFLGLSVYFPRLSANAQTMEGQSTMTLFIFVLVISVIMWLLPVPLFFYCNGKISNRHKNARQLQVFSSLLSLIFFPAGTLLHGGVLYLILFDQKAKAYFTGSTEHA